MNVVILGCGRVGVRLADRLDARHEVTVIDRNPAAFERLSPDFRGRTMVGNGIDVDVLRSAGVPGADAFIALTQEDDRNLMSGQIASQLGARRVVARVYDPVRGDIFSERGLVTFSPTVQSAERLFAMLTGEEAE